jgi:hypothetical protein
MQMLSNANSCEPVDINNAGISIGNCWMSLGRPPIPVLWEGSAIRRPPIDVPTGVMNLTLTGMNDQGMVTALGFILETGPDEFPISRTRGFLFSPVYESLTLAMHLNQASFRPSETLHVELHAENPGPILATDVYFGVIFPDGERVLFLTRLSPLDGVTTTLSGDPRTFRPLFTNLELSPGLDVTLPNFFSYTFTGAEAPGTYQVVAALTPPGALNDSSVDAGDVLAVVVPFEMRPPVVGFAARVQAIRARHQLRDHRGGFTCADGPWPICTGLPGL